MKARELIVYSRELGWTDPPELAEAPRRPAGRDTPGEHPGRERATRAPAAPVTAASSDQAAQPVQTAQETAARCTSLDELARHLDGCQRCRLGETRRSLVFGEGAPGAQIMLIGEGPGAEEDRTGRPFVGQAGQLLDAMILALGLRRDQVYIANVVKCRPPRNRPPEADETTACAPFLDRQIDLVGPGMIVALGRPAAQRLTGSTRPLGAMRGRWASYRGLPVLPTFHPAYLLRNPADKRLSWEDLKLVRERLRGVSGSPPGT
jgi:DNA polymerase